MRRTAAFLAAVSLLTLALTSVARGATLCVDHPGCTAAATYSDLEPALAAATTKPGADEVLIGEGVFTGPFHYDSAEPISIVGAGTATVLRPGTGLTTLSLLGGAGKVADLRIRVDNVGGALGLETDGVASGLTLVHNGSMADVQGVLLRLGGRFEDGLVDLERGTAIEAEATTPLAAVRNSTLRSNYMGLNVRSGQMSAERVRIEGPLTALRSGNFATLHADHVAAEPRSSGNGVTVGPGSTFEGRHLTLVGAGGTGSGLDVVAFGGATSTATIESTAIAGFGAAINRLSLPGFGTTIVTASRSAWSGPVVSEGSGYLVAPGSIPDATLPVSAGRPLAGSDAVDSADPIEPAPFDLDGLPRVTDGDGDGVARADIGAYELQSQVAGGPGDGPPGPGSGPADLAPSIDRLRVTPRRLSASGRGKVRVRFAISEPATVSLRLTRRAGHRWLSTGRRFEVALAAGAHALRLPFRLPPLASVRSRYRLIAVAVDAAGNRSGRAVARFQLTSKAPNQEVHQ